MTTCSYFCTRVASLARCGQAGIRRLTFTAIVIGTVLLPVGAPAFAAQKLADPTNMVLINPLPEIEEVRTVASSGRGAKEAHIAMEYAALRSRLDQQIWRSMSPWWESK